MKLLKICFFSLLLGWLHPCSAEIQTRRILIQAAEVRLSARTFNRIETPTSSFWSRFQETQHMIPFEWIFVNSKGSTGAESISLLTTSAIELLRYKALSVTIPRGTGSMRIDEAQRIRQFLEGGGFLWVNLLASEKEVSNFLKSFPWPTVWSNLKSLDEIPGDWGQEGNTSLPPYPHVLSQEDLQVLRQMKTKLVRIGNGYALFTQAARGENPMEEIFRDPQGAHPLAELIINTLAELGGFASIAQNAGQTFSSRLTALAPLLRYRSLNYEAQGSKIEQPPVFFRGRVILVVNEKGVRKLRVCRLWNVPALTTRSKYPNLASPFGEVIGETTLLGGEEIVAPPACCDQTGMILLLGSRRTLYLYHIDKLYGEQEANPEAAVPLDGNPLKEIAPTLHEGLAYLALESEQDTNKATLYIYDVVHRTFLTRADGAEKYIIPIPMPAASPTVGYVPARDSSGAYDLMVFVASRETNEIKSVWLGSKFERVNLNIDSKKPDTLVISTRAARSIVTTQTRSIYTSDLNPSFKPRITFVTPEGQVIRYTIKKALGKEEGNLSLSIKSELNEKNLGKKVTFSSDSIKSITAYLDYHVDVTSGTLGFSFPFPTSEDRKFQPLGSLALSPQGTLFAVASPPTWDATRSNGILYAFLPIYNGPPVTLYRWDLYDTMSIPRPGGGVPTPYSHPLKSFPGRNLSNFMFGGGPVVAGDVVYVPIHAQEQGIPTSLMLGFKTFAPSFEFYADGDPTARGNVLRIFQPSPVAPGAGTIGISLSPETFDTLTRKVSLLTLATGTTALSTSVPVFAYTSTKMFLVDPEEIVARGDIFPGRARGRWSPVIFVSNTLQPEQTLRQEGERLILSQPIALGKQLFFVAGKKDGSEAALYSLDTLFQLGTSFKARPIRNASLSVPAEGARISAGMKTLFIWNPKALDLFTRIHAVIASASRISKWSHEGKEIWSVWETVVQGRNGIDEKRTPFSSPVRVYQDLDQEGTFWAVDAGANRIVRFDPKGNELRSIESFMMDPLNRPEGTSQNLPQVLARDLPNSAPLQIQRPRDVSLFRTRRVSSRNNFFSNPQPSESWDHFLIADTESKRLIEVVNRFNAVTRAPIRVEDPVSGSWLEFADTLLWYSPPNFGGLDVSYHSVDRMMIPGMGPLIAFGFSGNEHGTLLYNPGENKKTIFTEFQVSAPTPEKPNNTQAHHLKGLKTATLNLQLRKEGGAPSVGLMMVDATGVHELVTGDRVDITQASQLLKEDSWKLQWSLPNETLSQLVGAKGKRQATYAKRLPTGDVLIVYGTFGGEFPQSGLMLLKSRFKGNEQNEVLFKLDTELHKLPLVNIQHAVVEY